MTVVTPWLSLEVWSGLTRICRSEWVCMSMKPGAMQWPEISTIRSEAGAVPGAPAPRHARLCLGAVEPEALARAAGIVAPLLRERPWAQRAMV